MINKHPYYWGTLKYDGQLDNARLNILPHLRPEYAEIIEDSDKNRKTVFEYKEPQAKILCEEIKSDGAVFVQNTVTNIGNSALKLTHISSCCIGLIPTSGKTKWYEKDRFILHQCNSTWQGEGQWIKNSLSDLGLLPASNHHYYNMIEIRSVGSHSTAYKYPIVILEDTELHKAYFCETEAGCSWVIQITAENIDGCDTLCIEGSTAAASNDGWHKTLKKGESYSASPAIVGEVDGGFEEAVHALTMCRRKVQKRGYEELPVIFNDYMNCLWARPSAERLLPLIDKAAEVGADIFCIDAGWFKSNNPSETMLGDWEWDDAKFPGGGFEGIIRRIREKGMKPGVWLEIEGCSENSNTYKTLNDCLLRRNGEIIAKHKGFLDFRKKKTTDYMMSVFDRLYEAGVRFIKNDYNQSVGIGTDGSDSLSEGLVENSRAVRDFLDRVQEKYKDLQIEACASGALRSDMAFLRGAYIQSVSDQEFYCHNPSIICGSAACYLPEKAGIWSYPYPLPYEKRRENDYFPAAARLTDTEETVFNMVNSMTGVMYLSGHIDYADEKNTELIKEGIAAYKKYRTEFRYAYPIFPSGTFKLTDKVFAAYGLKTENAILLSVWRIGTDVSTKCFDLSKWVGEHSAARVIYPIKEQTVYTYENRKLTVTFDKKYMARSFYITI